VAVRETHERGKRNQEDEGNGKLPYSRWVNCGVTWQKGIGQGKGRGRTNTGQNLRVRIKKGPNSVLCSDWNQGHVSRKKKVRRIRTEQKTKPKKDNRKKRGGEGKKIDKLEEVGPKGTL